jgi:hypothetical protein
MPVESNKKVMMVCDFAEANTASQNKLLKLLEEPPFGVVFLLGATSAFSVLPTVLSRTARLEIFPFSDGAIEDFLTRHYPTATDLAAFAAASIEGDSPKEREDCGYVVTLGDAVRIYISGDTEPTEEQRGLKNIDIAFICVNQPYTMTPEQAVEAVKALRPAIYYPYHYGQVDEPTDVEALAKMLDGVCDVRIRPLA